MEVDKLVTEMQEAYNLDIQANKEGQPSIRKLALLNRVEEMIGKKALQEELLERGILVEIKKWFEPLPDGALPNLKIRTILLKSLLANFTFVGTEDLRSSGIGRTINILSKSQNEVLDNKKICAKLIEKWSRPLFGLSDSYAQLKKNI